MLKYCWEEGDGADSSTLLFALLHSHSALEAVLINRVLCIIITIFFPADVGFGWLSVGCNGTRFYGTAWALIVVDNTFLFGPLHVRLSVAQSISDFTLYDVSEV